VKVLIVDDDVTKLQLLKSLVESQCSASDIVNTEATGLAAREKLSQIHYDLLILDIALPFRDGDAPDEKGGLTLLVELERSQRFKKPSNVLALTGFSVLQEEFLSKFNNGVWGIDLYDPADSGWRERLVAKVSYLKSSLDQAKQQSFESDVCIVTALSSPELDFVRRIPWGFGTAQAFDSVSFQYSGRFSSRSKEYSIDAISAPRMGMVATATLVSKVICNLRPRMVIMAGICAGIPGEAELGEVVVADPAWDWQMGKYTKETFEINPDQIGLSPEITEKFKILAQDSHALLALAEKFEGERPSTMPRIKPGPMASGSAVIANEAITADVRKQNRKLMAFDMEMYAVYSACRDAASPRPRFFGLKGVCDHADHYKNDKYQKYSSHLSAGAIQLFLERYAADLL
jgi:nucleoside phosphorylase/DNA-binding NarL/FixJ family response regulator